MQVHPERLERARRPGSAGAYPANRTISCVPQIQEPDDRFWTLLRVLFVALLLASLIHLVWRGFLAPSAADTLPFTPPAHETETP